MADIPTHATEENHGHSADHSDDVVLANGLVINHRFKNAAELSVARRPIFSSTLSTTVIDLDELPLPTTSAPVANDEPPLALDDLFPDLALYSGPSPPEDDKVPKRLDEGFTSSHRIAHTSRIMDLHPVLVSAVQPAKNTTSGSWDLRDGLWYEDPHGSADLPQEVIATTSSIFHGRSSRTPHAPLNPPMPQPAAHKLRPTLVWTDEEDQVLLHLVSTYPFNWPLITDCFNSEVVTIPTEIRNPYECWERWHYTYGPGKGTRPEPETAISTPLPTNPTPAAPSSAAAPPGTATTVPPQSATGPAGPSQPASVNPESGEAPPPPGLSKREAKAAARNKYEGSKKSIRHQVIYDSVRRLVRRREAAKLKNSEFVSMPSLTCSKRLDQAGDQRPRESLGIPHVANLDALGTGRAKVPAGSPDAATKTGADLGRTATPRTATTAPAADDEPESASSRGSSRTRLGSDASRPRRFTTANAPESACAQHGPQPATASQRRRRRLRRQSPKRSKSRSRKRPTSWSATCSSTTGSSRAHAADAASSECRRSACASRRPGTYPARPE